MMRLAYLQAAARGASIAGKYSIRFGYQKSRCRNCFLSDQDKFVHFALRSQ